MGAYLVGESMTTLIFTNSTDVTVDLIMYYLSPSEREKIFRFNFDLFGSYLVDIAPDGFTLEDQIGRRVASEEVTKMYFRKPMRTDWEDSEKNYIEEEQWAIYMHLVIYLWKQDKIVLVDPFGDRRLPKFIQLDLAKDFFRVPNTIYSNQITKHINPDNPQKVVKPLTQSIILNGYVFAKLVDAIELDPSYPWFLQDYVDASHDVTVVYVRGEMYGFSLERYFLEETVDFRAPMDDSTWKNWKAYELPEAFQLSIQEFMSTVKLDYGRLDFLMLHNGTFVFCEVNPNGQFGWLDLQNETGMISTIGKVISPLTPVTSIPFSPF